MTDLLMTGDDLTTKHRELPVPSNELQSSVICHRAGFLHGASRSLHGRGLNFGRVALWANTPQETLRASHRHIRARARPERDRCFSPGAGNRLDHEVCRHGHDQDRHV